MRRTYIVAWSAVILLIAVVFVDLERVRGWRNSVPEAVGFRGEIGGTVRSLDADTRVVTVARGALDFSSISIAITEDTRVNVRGKLGAFGDLREGLALSVCYEMLTSGRWARSIEMPPSRSPCDAVAESAPPDSSEEGPARVVALPEDRPSPQPAAAPAAAFPTSPRPGAAHASTRLGVPEQPGPAPAPVVTRSATLPAPVISRPAPASTPVKAGAVSPKWQPEDTPAPARRRSVETAAETPRRSQPRARSSEDYGALIDWVHAERAAVAKPSGTESVFAARALRSQTESATPDTSRQSAVRSAVPRAPEPPPAMESRLAESRDRQRAAPSGLSDRSQAVGPDVATASAAPESQSTGAAIAKPTCTDIAAALPRESSVDGRSRNQRLVDCVGGWLKSESQEVRDGFKRGVEEFRTAVDELGRGLQRLGEKLRP